MTYIARLRGRARRWAGPLAGLTAASLLLGLAGPAAPAAADDADLTDGLALWYKLDATSGTTVTDASGNGRNGTVNGTAGWTGDPAFSEETFPAIHRYTAGIPRRINLLCDRLLLMGRLDEKHAFTEMEVAEVIADLREEFPTANINSGGG